MRKDRDLIRQLRREGRSYNEITAVTGAGKGAINYIVSDIELTPEQQARLRKKSLDGAARGRANVPIEKRREMGRKAGLSWWRNNPERARKNLAKAVVASALSYLPGELIAKERLSEIYGEEFCKKKIGKYYFDFVSGTRIIKHTKDGKGKGLRAAITRFQSIHSDPRKKHVYVDTTFVGKRRRLELKKAGVQLHDLHELDAEDGM